MKKTNPPPQQETIEVAAQTPQQDPRLQKILTLLGLMKNARHKARRSEFEFLMVNQTFNLIAYRSCVHWLWDGHDMGLRAASGLVQVDPNGPYALWLGRVVKNFLQENGKKILLSKDEGEDASGETGKEFGYARVLAITPEMCQPEDKAEWKNWSAAYAIILVFLNDEGNIFGGLWIDRDVAFHELDLAFLEDLGDSYAHILNQFEKLDKFSAGKAIGRRIFRLSRARAVQVAAVIFVVLCLPVRMSITAPAEIVAHDPWMVSVPFDGIIEDVVVSPGQIVKQGDVLARMDGTVLRNKSELATHQLATAEIALTKTERESFSDRAKLAELGILRAQSEQKAAEKKYADEMLEKIEIKAERDGVVIFSDANSLRGKPVQTGEQIMQLADPSDSELMIRVPVDSMIRIDETIPAKFFLNVNPLHFREANYRSIGYQATPDPDGLLTYKVRARFDAEGENPRIGWTGTGKVYGDRSIMAFNILRRPIATLRRKLGI